MAVRIPAEVFEDLEEVRRSGETNMLDLGAVMYFANQNEAHETVLWLHDNKDLYARGIFKGFEPVGAVKDDEEGERA